MSRKSDKVPRSMGLTVGGSDLQPLVRKYRLGALRAEALGAGSSPENLKTI